MLSINLAQLKSDIGMKMKGTSVRQITDFYGVAFGAANRMTARIDPVESSRIATLSMPFFDNVQDYVLPEDYKRMVDIRPQANLRQDLPGRSNFGMTDNKQFSERLDWNSFAIRWNNMIRTLRAQRLPAGNVMTMDDFDVTMDGVDAVSNGTWVIDQGITSLYREPLNYVQGNSALGINISGTGAAEIINDTAAIMDLSAFNNEDWSMMFIYIPVGYSSRISSVAIARGDNSSNYISQEVTTKADGTAFSDGWNFLAFNWATGTEQGSPTNTLNTWRAIVIDYTGVTAIPGVLIDSWSDSFGQLYEIEYYSEYMFRSATTGAWKSRPDDDSDLINIGPASYEILQAEMMVDISKIIRTGAVQNQETTEWRKTLNGDPLSRWVKTQQDKGLYNDYITKFPSRAIVQSTTYYDFDV